MGAVSIPHRTRTAQEMKISLFLLSSVLLLSTTVSSHGVQPTCPSDLYFCPALRECIPHIQWCPPASQIESCKQGEYWCALQQECLPDSEPCKRYPETPK